MTNEDTEAETVAGYLATILHSDGSRLIYRRQIISEFADVALREVVADLESHSRMSYHIVGGIVVHLVPTRVVIRDD